jgi:two-component sensor histidine kinase
MAGLDTSYVLEPSSLKKILEGYPGTTIFDICLLGSTDLNTRGEILSHWKGDDKDLFLMTLGAPSMPESLRASLPQEGSSSRVDRSPMIWTVDRNYCYQSFNEAHRREMKRVWGVDIREGMNILEALPDPRYRRLVRYNYDRALGGEHFYTVDELEDEEGNHRYFENIAGPVLDASGTIYGLKLHTVELTDSEEVRECIAMNIAIQRSLIEGYGNIGVCSLDRFYRFRAFNDAYRSFMEDIRGVKIRIGVSLLDSLPSLPVRREIKQKLDEVLQGDTFLEERNYSSPDGEVRYYRNRYIPIRSDRGIIQGVTVSITDITEEKLRSREEQQRLQEGELLARALHSRVKTNLQILTSLINIQRRDEEGDGAVQRSLNALAVRVRTLSVIHEHLFRNRVENQVMGLELFRKILSLGADFTGAAGRGIGYEALGEPLLLDVEQALPLGLLVNELALNSFIHGFPQGKSGTVTVELRQAAGGTVLAVADDGQGFPGAPQMTEDRYGTGLRFVAALASQLGGDFSLRRGEKTEGRMSLS